MKQHFFLFISAFVALFPVINPLGSSLIVNGFLENLSKEDRVRAVRKIILYCFMVGFGSLLLGHLVLELFGLAIPIIQFGGGILICKTGLDFLWDSNNKSDQGKNISSHISFEDVRKSLFYPISFPITVGAGTISVIFTLMANGWKEGHLLDTTLNYFFIVLALVAMFVIYWILLSKGYLLISKMGESTSLIINKLVAFITFCVGLQILFTGLSNIFHLHIL